MISFPQGLGIFAPAGRLLFDLALPCLFFSEGFAGDCMIESPAKKIDPDHAGMGLTSRTQATGFGWTRTVADRRWPEQEP